MLKPSPTGITPIKKTATYIKIPDNINEPMKIITLKLDKDQKKDTIPKFMSRIRKYFTDIPKTEKSITDHIKEITGSLDKQNNDKSSEQQLNVNIDKLSSDIRERYILHQQIGALQLLPSIRGFPKKGINGKIRDVILMYYDEQGGTKDCVENVRAKSIVKACGCFRIKQIIGDVFIAKFYDDTKGTFHFMDITPSDFDTDLPWFKEAMIRNKLKENHDYDRFLNENVKEKPWEKNSTKTKDGTMVIGNEGDKDDPKKKAEYRKIMQKHNMQIPEEFKEKPPAPPKTEKKDDKKEEPKIIKCGFKQCKKEGISRCMGCLSIKYCGRECQVKHWKKHKQRCKYIQKLNEHNKKINKKK